MLSNLFRVSPSLPHCTMYTLFIVPSPFALVQSATLHISVPVQQLLSRWLTSGTSSTISYLPRQKVKRSSFHSVANPYSPMPLSFQRAAVTSSLYPKTALQTLNAERDMLRGNSEYERRRIDQEDVLSRLNTLPSSRRDQHKTQHPHMSSCAIQTTHGSVLVGLSTFPASVPNFDVLFPD